MTGKKEDNPISTGAASDSFILAEIICRPLPRDAQYKNMGLPSMRQTLGR